MTLPLEVFRCLPVEKGWGVRCREFVPAGTFVACYQGELLDEVRESIEGFAGQLSVRQQAHTLTEALVGVFLFMPSFCA